jgi:alpha/beta superfamily hydrolase
MKDDKGLEITGIQSNVSGHKQEHIIINTPNGNIDCLLHIADSNRGVIWVCGALGGMDGPSFGIFRILSEKLVDDGFTSLRLNYRLPGNFDECVLDVVTGVDYLKRRNINKIALVGHSFGGAVVIEAGVRSHDVKAVIGLSSQTYGVKRVAELSPRPLLLIHGERDRNLSVRCSQYIYEWAREPKELVIYKNNGHFLRENHKELLAKVQEWLLDKLGHIDPLKAT